MRPGGSLIKSKLETVGGHHASIAYRISSSGWFVARFERPRARRRYGSEGSAAPAAVRLDRFYGGVNTGYSWGHSRATTDSTALGVTDTEWVAHHGWEASVEGGYCWQSSTSTAMVACIEARYDFPREHSGQTTTTTLPLTTLTNSTNVDPFLIGPHLGFLTDSNHMMWYAAGGLAIGEVGGSSTGVGVGERPPLLPATKRPRVGFLVPASST